MWKKAGKNNPHVTQHLAETAAGALLVLNLIIFHQSSLNRDAKEPREEKHLHRIQHQPSPASPPESPGPVYPHDGRALSPVSPSPCRGVPPCSPVSGQALLSGVTWLAACVSPALLLTQDRTGISWAFLFPWPWAPVGLKDLALKGAGGPSACWGLLGGIVTLSSPPLLTVVSAYCTELIC